ncbi:MAG: methyl-accepting chemotaxis protein, partial [Desulfocucumaceae bacterium]
MPSTFLAGWNSDLQVISDHVQIIARQNNLSVDIIKKLNHHSSDIVRALETIEGIAQRINLLSLNASIEAAKAGESERDFAVVAGEVRKLADQSSKVVQEIGVLVSGIRKSAVKALDAVNEEQIIVKDETEKIISLQKNMGGSLTTIEEFLRYVREIPEMVSQISGSVQNVAAVAQQTGDTSQEMDKALISVGEMVGELNSLSDKFKIDVDVKDGKGKQSKFKSRMRYLV